MAVTLACFAIGYHASSSEAATKKSTTNIQLCQNMEYALCAGSTCTKTGKKIKVRTPQGGYRYFDEAVCKCPVLTSGEGKEAAIANVGGGNMNGTCASTDGTVWSLYATVAQFPQQSAGWDVKPADLNTQCTASLNQGRNFANCWSCKCSKPYNVKNTANVDVKIADCKCPVGEDVLSALPTKPATGFFTNAGGWLPTANQQKEYCYKTPVGGF